MTLLINIRNYLVIIKQKNTDKNIDVVGHSLGAKIAETLGDAPQKKSLSINQQHQKYLIQKTNINNKLYDISRSGLWTF